MSVPPLDTAVGSSGQQESVHSTSSPATGKRGRVFLFIVLTVLLVAVATLWLGWEQYRVRREWDGALEASRRHDLEAAATHYDQYVRLRPQDPEGWLGAARTARRQGKFEAAERYLRQCEKVSGPSDTTRLEQDLIIVQQGILGEIDIRLRASVGPDDPNVLLILEALARGYLTAGRWADARQACEMWRTLQPDHPWPWLWGGWVSERLGQTEQATELYRHAFEMVPEDRDTRVAFARVLLRQRRAGEAVAHYEWVIARTPDDAESLLGLAECWIEQGRAKDAVRLIDRVLDHNPGSPNGLFLRGKAAMQRDDPVGAESWLRKAVQGQPGDTESLHLLVLSLHAQGKSADADEHGRRLEILRADLRRLGELLLTITPATDARPCYEAGVIALRVGRTKEGVNLLHDALRRKGDYRPAHAALAAYYGKMGQQQLADLHQRHARTP